MKKRKLPPPNVSYRRPDSPDRMDESTLRGVMCNPVYTGIASFPRILDDEAWVKAAAQLIAEEGAEQFLVNMLYMLRRSLAEEKAGSPPESEEDGLFPFYCSHDGLPVVPMGEAMVCVGEYLFSHLEWSSVRDLLSEPVLTLVFQNGHTLPLLCPDCRQSLHADEDQLLNALNGLSLIDVEWDDETAALLLYFSQLPDVIEDPEVLGQVPVQEVLEVHLNVVYGLTCPGLQKA